MLFKKKYRVAGIFLKQANKLRNMGLELSSQ